MDRSQPKEDTTYPPVPSTTLLHILDPLPGFGLLNIQHHLEKDLSTFQTHLMITVVIYGTPLNVLMSAKSVLGEYQDISSTE